VNTALYYSTVNGKIVTVEWPNPHYPSAVVDLARNLDSVSFWGFEAVPEIVLKEFLNAGLAFSLNRYKINHSQNGINAIAYYPEITLNGYVVYKPVKVLSIIPRIEYLSSRYTDSLGEKKLDSYFLAHFKISADILKWLSLSAGIDNIFDKLYEIRLNSPMPGRSFNFTAMVKY
jgi:iron complex outermembrane receptor protein